MPTEVKNSRLRGSRYSALSMRATVFLAPKLLASMQQVRLRVSDGVTAMKRSACGVPASLRPLMLVGETESVIKSRPSLALANLFSSGSMRTMSWFSWVSSAAKWLPTAPAPAMMIFIGKMMSLCLMPRGVGGVVYGLMPSRRV